MEPLLSSVGDSVEAILLTLHKEDFSGEVEQSGPSPAAACSLYMRELQAFMERIARDFLSTFTCNQFLASQLQPLADKTIQRFVLQVSRDPAVLHRAKTYCRLNKLGLETYLTKKSRVRETLNLSTDANRSSNTKKKNHNDFFGEKTGCSFFFENCVIAGQY